MMLVVALTVNQCTWSPPPTTTTSSASLSICCVISSTMTHGVGVIGGGGGGGGGFSSGFSSGSTVMAAHHITNSRRRGRNVGNDNNDTGCCSVICYVVAFLLCCVSMKPRTRIILLWVYVIAGSILTGSLVGRHVGGLTFSISPSDMRKIDGISSVLCQEVIVDCTTAISTYVLKEEPILSDEKTFYFDKTTEIDRNDYEYWGFYLLEDSTVTVRFCGGDGVEFYVIIGDNNFNRWTENYQCSHCYDVLLSAPSCLNHMEEYTLQASTTDQYYFVFVNNDRFIQPPASVIVKFNLDRLRYTLTPEDILCDSSMDCYVPLTMVNPDRIVIDIPDTVSFDNAVNVICQPRFYMYILLFGVLPVNLAILVTIVILRCAKRKTTRQRSPSQICIISTNNDPLHGVVNSSHSSLGHKVGPPSYKKAPPTYEEATADVR